MTKVLPSNGGLKNPLFPYRRAGTSRDLRESMQRAAQEVHGGLPLRHPKLTVIVDRVVPVKRFGGI